MVPEIIFDINATETGEYTLYFTLQDANEYPKSETFEFKINVLSQNKTTFDAE